jgi:hypothetical protein
MLAGNSLIMPPLTIDTTGQHRRRLWEAFDEQGGRCGRWSKLHRLNATVRAAPDPSTVEEYRRPHSLELRHNVVHDPEDNPTPEPIDPRRPSGRAVIA